MLYGCSTTAHDVAVGSSRARLAVFRLQPKSNLFSFFFSASFISLFLNFLGHACFRGLARTLALPIVLFWQNDLQVCEGDRAVDDFFSYWMTFSRTDPMHIKMQ
jgi:hypothetical protein